MDMITTVLNFTPPDAAMWIEPHLLVDRGIYIIWYWTDGTEFTEINREEVK